MTNLAKNRFSEFCAKFAIFIKIAFFKGRFSIPFDLTRFSSESRLSKEPFAISFEFLLTLANFRHFRQIGHYRQNRYFGRGPFAISFDLFITLWRIFAIFTVFAKFAIFAKSPLLKWTHDHFISLVPKALAKFRVIRQFRQNRPFPIFFFIAIVWISLYTYISAKLIQVHWKNLLFFVVDLKCQPFLTFYTWRYFETKLKCFEARISLMQWLCVRNLIFFPQSDSFQTRWIFYLWSWL